ncbi:hypothetical protein [Nocardiopsis sp. NRRL B-16309]|uniref:hypothetical protein n=1 Tax=Nocardiopsis sp. NRRL B-16309 TaxID=1519494 RepID=UPI0006AF7DB6|nr:hypothetical protein [Nocardiopsis sp. NRRL B-16309]
MSENTPETPQDPINPDEADWEEAGLPAQEDATEDAALPTDREGPAPMGGTADVYASEGGRSLDDAMAQEVPDRPEAGGSAAPSEAEAPGQGRGERRTAHSAEEQAVHERTEEGR